jgi:Arc/MetJ-type ribon-helix-helix transcriptional regulator
MATKRITISVPIEIAKRIRVAAGESHSISEWIAGAVEQTLEQEDVKRRFIAWCEQTPTSGEDERKIARAFDRIRKGSAPVRGGRKKAA